VSTSTAIAVCRTIKGVDLDIRATPGTALMNEATGAVIYTPPEGQALLRDKLANWERYIHEAEDVDPLIRLAVMHYQFEAIHPFTDGNGRTGRVLNLLYLVDKGLLDIPVLYLSRYIIGNKRAYYDRLLAVTTEYAWEDWILYMLEAIRETAKGEAGNGALQAERDLLATALDDVQGMLGALVGHFGKHIYLVGLNTTPFLFALSELTIGWLLLRQAEVALEKLGGDVSEKDQAFYEGKVAAASFFARTNLPRLTAERRIAEATDLALMDLDEASF
jgi:hypothetical protein